MYRPEYQPRLTHGPVSTASLPSPALGADYGTTRTRYGQDQACATNRL